MIKIVDQIGAGKHLLLLLDTDRPLEQYSHVTIDGTEYKPIIPYGVRTRNCVAIDSTDNFIGKEIKFV